MLTNQTGSAKQYIKLSEKDRKELIVSLNKVLGQLEAVKAVIERDQVESQTFNQLLAVKGGAGRICKEIISRGVIPNIAAFSPQEIDRALDIIFRLD